MNRSIMETLIAGVALLLVPAAILIVAVIKEGSVAREVLSSSDEIQTTR